MKKLFMVMVVIVAGCIAIRPSWAEEDSHDLQGIEILSGYSQGDLKEKQDYRFINLAVALDFNLKRLTKKIGFNPPSLVQFQIEPFFGFVFQPEKNIEVGTSFLFKFGLVPETWKLQPYIKLGTGMVFMSQHTIEQSTQFNFISGCGAGFHYFFKENNAITIEYRFRHLSNASIKDPNNGINTYSCLFGITRLF
jgi:hypothetical protein